MKLEELIVKDWAGHKQKTLKFDGSVIGFSGENGAGKTTLLEAIAYSIIGKLPQKRTAVDRIRDYGLKGGATHAEVTAKFNRRNKKFDIYRKLAVKGSERLLTLDDGSTFTYAEQVDEQIGNILGTDVDTLTNILFIPQGDLKNILFGTTSEQEKLLIKILDVGHVKQAYEVISKKINTLIGKINPNIETQIAEVNYDIEQKEAGLHSMTVELSNLPKIAKDNLNSCLVLLRMLELKDEEFRNENLNIARLRERLVSLNTDGRIEFIRSNASISNGDSEIKTQVASLEKRKVGIKSVVIPLCETIVMHEEAIKRFNIAIPKLTDQQITIYPRLIELGLTYGTHKVHIDEYVNSIAEIQKSESQIANLRNEVIELSEEINKTKHKYTEASTQIKSLYVYESDICGDLNCTVCGSVVSAEKVKENKETLSTLKSQLEKITETGKLLSELKKTKELEISGLESEIGRLKGLKSFNRELIELVNNNPELYSVLPDVNKIWSEFQQYTNTITAKKAARDGDVNSLAHAVKMYNLLPFVSGDISEYMEYVGLEIKNIDKQINDSKWVPLPVMV